MIQASCHCGAVVLETAAPPHELTDCNCTICRRYGALWAYYSPRDVKITGATEFYVRGEKMIEFHRCKVCGCLTHWEARDKTRDRMGVNARMMEPKDFAAARIYKLDGFDTWKRLE